MQDACYEKRCDYILKLAESFGHDMGITLDLACGTGTLTRLLKKRGVDVFGIDYSMEMLSEAMQRASEEGLDILFLRQKMQSIDLYGTINTCVCTLDSINHLTKIEDVAKTFDRVGLFMDDDGLFIFDVNTVYKHKNILADNTFVYENDSVFCVWQNTPEDDNKVKIDLDFFEEENGVYYRSSESFSERAYTDAEIKAIFNKVYGGAELTKEEILKFKSAMLVIFGEMDWEKGWTQQFHYGAIRNNNTKMFKLLGADTGFDSIGEFTTAKAMAKFLDRLNTNGKLTKTILYNLNPCANEVIATMLGNFQDGSIPGKIQFGSGWWFLDQKDGMEKQMNALSVLGLLSRFVGMLTDSRSFLSYPRHEYFRRTLCNLVGRDVENGEIPVSEMERVNQMIEDISYNNAKNFFKF